MHEPVRKFLIADRDASDVPFNYMIAKYPVRVGHQPKLDVVNGRHVERTFNNGCIQNPTAKKVFFYKPITRYEVRF